MKAVEMMRDKDDLYNIIGDMFAGEDIVASLNKTNKSKIKRLRKELAEKDQALSQAISEKDQVRAERDQALAEINRLRAELKTKNQE